MDIQPVIYSASMKIAVFNLIFMTSKALFSNIFGQIYSRMQEDNVNLDIQEYVFDICPQYLDICFDIQHQ